VQPATAGPAAVIEATATMLPVKARVTAIAKMILRMNGSRGQPIDNSWRRFSQETGPAPPFVKKYYLRLHERRLKPQAAAEYRHRLRQAVSRSPGAAKPTR
jgi:hypothetical protein